ncbi:MAG: hypothetical protein J6Q82_01255 [Clostridia bacterium]|nr:hypothetical protein [Clostridia bacterium]
MVETKEEFLVDAKKLNLGTEEALYQSLRELTEQDTERKVATIVRNREEIKAAYRAAVYGEISLLFGDIFTGEDAEQAKSTAHLAFRELLEEKHEFNGFIPKGILIDTPLALLSQIPTDGIDFFCYDIEKLSILLAEEKKRVPMHRRSLEVIIAENMNSSLPTKAILSKIMIDRGIWIYRK